MAEENTEITVTEIHGKRVQQEIIALDLEKSASLPPDIRNEKILTIRQQLAQGKYSIDERLNVVLDKIFENIVT